MNDPWAGVYYDALEFCGSLVAAPEHYGSPVFVSMLERTVVHPPCRIKPGMPVIDLIVQSDGVVIALGRRGGSQSFSASFHRFPTLFGEPFLSGRQGAEWRESLDIDLAVALGQLRQLGQTSTSTWP
jgi:hypothetical protein